MREWFKRFWTQFHSWTYRNPHDRTCTQCGLKQNRFAMKYGDTGWWEDMNYGHAAPCNNPAAAKEGAQKEQSK